MKHTKLLAVACLVFLLSCNESQTKKSENVMSFISGAYVRAFEGEFSIGHDTLIISQPDAGNNYYTIKHNTSYQKIRDKQLQPLEYKSENWTAIFDEKENVLMERKKGKMISFLPDQNELLLGGSRFHKIK
jgi:hypothetical protein